LDPTNFPDDEQAYPIEFIVRGTDAVILLFDHKRGVPRLRFERWKGTWINQETDEIRVRRYFGPNGKTAFGQLTLDHDWQGAIRNLADQFRLAADDDRNRYWSEYHAQRKEISVKPPSADCVIIRADRAGRLIGLPWTPLFGPFVEATVLDKPLLQCLLERCGGGATSDEIAASLNRQLDSRRISQLLTWSTRYDDVAISGAYFFRMDMGPDRRPLFSATRDAEGFAADPLLIDLSESPVELPAARDDSPAPRTPQFPSGLPITTLRQRDVISGLIATPFGALPRPSAKRASATRRAAGLQPTMNRFRWWMLQLLDLSTAVLANLPPKEPIQLLLALQRVALLQADCRTAFAAVSDPDKKIELIRDLAADRYRSTFQGRNVCAPIRRKADLPQA
jgi:hypothetical protein